MESSKAPRGLQGVVELIHAEVGQMVGSRNTFAKLFRAQGPEEMDEKDQYRAWLLLCVFGQDPARWGIPDTVVPRAHDPERLGAALSRGDALYEPDADDLQAMREWEATADPRELTRDFSAEDSPEPPIWEARAESIAELCGCDEGDVDGELTVT